MELARSELSAANKRPTFPSHYFAPGAVTSSSSSSASPPKLTPGFPRWTLTSTPLYCSAREVVREGQRSSSMHRGQSARRQFAQRPPRRRGAGARGGQDGMGKCETANLIRNRCSLPPVSPKRRQNQSLRYTCTLTPSDFGGHIR